MKNLQEFRQLVEEEKSDYSKFDMLVRAGLANKAQLARLHRILDKMTEERPQFNNADREIMRNLFNRMVDLIANNKQIFQKTRQAVREEVEETQIDAVQFTEATLELPEDPPFVLVLKRKAIRLYPNRTKVALYYNQKLDKYFSVPYGGGVDAPVQSEETQIEEAVMDQLHKIVKDKQAQTVKFSNGQTRKVDHYTASAITQVHGALNDDNKKKFADMVHKSPAHLAKASDFAFSRTK
jgi:hypothetical protein